VFGWAKFRNTPSRLELLESEVAYQTDGIVIGTTRTLPAPTSLVLAGLCAVRFSIARHGPSGSKVIPAHLAV